VAYCQFAMAVLEPGLRNPRFFGKF